MYAYAHRILWFISYIFALNLLKALDFTHLFLKMFLRSQKVLGLR